MESLLLDPKILALLISLGGCAIDAVLGHLPDKYVPYIGLIRRIIAASKKVKKDEIK